MSRAVIQPSRLFGKLRLPPSKSDAHRAIICAGLAAGISRISPVEMSEDIQATCACMRVLGAVIEREGDALVIDGRGTLEVRTAELYCGESGSTLRFLLPVAAAGGIAAGFNGEGRLPQRPLGSYLNLLSKHGVNCVSGGGLPLRLSGKLSPGLYLVPGNVSSQMVSGLLFALPLLDFDSEIRLTTPLESGGYVEMTLYTLKKFGIEIEKTGQGYFIKGNQHYTPCDYTIEGDWSQSAFFFLAAALSGEIEVENLNPCSVQGDRKSADLFRAFGADLTVREGVYCVKAAPLSGIPIDASQIPDLIPALAVTAAFADGVTHIHSAGRLRMKESDRIASTCAGLRRIGVNVEEKKDSMIIAGGVSPGREILIDGESDHRIVMAFSAAACGLDQPVTVTDAQAVNKSYPGFFDDFKKLGGICDVLDDR